MRAPVLFCGSSAAGRDCIITSCPAIIAGSTCCKATRRHRDPCIPEPVALPPERDENRKSPKPVTRRQRARALDLAAPEPFTISDSQLQGHQRETRTTEGYRAAITTCTKCKATGSRPTAWRRMGFDLPTGSLERPSPTGMTLQSFTSSSIAPVGRPDDASRRGARA